MADQTMQTVQVSPDEIQLLTRFRALSLDQQQVLLVQAAQPESLKIARQLRDLTASGAGHEFDRLCAHALIESFRMSFPFVHYVKSKLSQDQLLQFAPFESFRLVASSVKRQSKAEHFRDWIRNRNVDYVVVPPDAKENVGPDVASWLVDGGGRPCGLLFMGLKSSKTDHVQNKDVRKNGRSLQFDSFFNGPQTDRGLGLRGDVKSALCRHGLCLVIRVHGVLPFKAPQRATTDVGFVPGRVELSFLPMFDAEGNSAIGYLEVVIDLSQIEMPVCGLFGDQVWSELCSVFLNQLYQSDTVAEY